MRLKYLPSVTLMALLVAVILGACSQNQQKETGLLDDNHSSAQLAPLTNNQINEDFQVVVANIRALYGPLEYKQKLFHFDFEKIVSESEKQIATAQTEEERMGFFYKFLAQLHDGHVSLHFQESAAETSAYLTGITLLALEDHAVVADIDPRLFKKHRRRNWR